MAVEKNIIPVSVEDRFVNVEDHTKVMSGNVGVDFVQVTLDSAWDGLEVEVTFKGCAENATTVAYSAGPIEIPWEQIAEPCDLHIGVRGTDPSGAVTVDVENGTVENSEVPTLNADTMLVPIVVFESGASGGAAPLQPSPTLLDRVQQDILHLEGLVGNVDDVVDKANQATTDATAAVLAANAATTQVTSAATKANAAADSANTAAGRVDASITAATKATENADAAASSANTAAAAAQQVVDDEAGHRAAAKASADAAAASASEASASAAAASGSATDAASSAAEAAASKAAAATSAATAASKADAAASSESNAATSANAAETSKTTAAASEASAIAAAKRAEDAAGKAEAIAGFKVDGTVSETSQNAVTSAGIYSFVADMAEQIRMGMVEIVDALPAEGKPGVIYMVTADTPTDGNLYAEYVYKGGKWEKLGDVQMPDLSPYAKTAEVAKAIQDALKAYTTTEELTGLLAAKQDALSFDAVPTEGSSNPVTSGGVKAALDTKANAGTVTELSADLNALSGTVAGKQDKLTIDASIAADSSGVPTSAAVRQYVADNGGGKSLSNAEFLELIRG